MSRLVLVAVLSFATAIPALPAQRAVELLGETNPFAALAGNRFDGLWWAEAAPGNSPIILTLSRSGTFELHTAVDNGAYLPFELSELRGVWRRTDHREAAGIALRFLYNLDGTIRTAVRSRFVIRFGADFDTLVISFVIEQINCETVEEPFSPTCPDIRTAPADASRAGDVTAYRVPFDAGL